MSKKSKLKIIDDIQSSLDPRKIVSGPGGRWPMEILLGYCDFTLKK